MMFQIHSKCNNEMTLLKEALKLSLKAEMMTYKIQLGSQNTFSDNEVRLQLDAKIVFKKNEMNLTLMEAVPALNLDTDTLSNAAFEEVLRDSVTNCIIKQF